VDCPGGEHSDAIVTSAEAFAIPVDSKMPQEEPLIFERAFVERIRRSDEWMIGLTAEIEFSGIASAAIFRMQFSAMRGQLTVSGALTPFFNDCPDGG
jgi:hypothetical protein